LNQHRKYKYNINVIVNKVACTLVRAKYFSQNFRPPLKKFLRVSLTTTTKPLLVQAQIPRSNVGQDARASPSSWRALRDSVFSSPTLVPTLLTKTGWIRLNRLRTGVGRFRSCLQKWAMVPSAACECHIRGLIELLQCCLAALDPGAGVEQSIDRLIIQNRRSCTP